MPSRCWEIRSRIMPGLKRSASGSDHHIRSKFRLLLCWLAWKEDWHSASLAHPLQPLIALVDSHAVLLLHQYLFLSMTVLFPVHTERVISMLLVQQSSSKLWTVLLILPHP